MRNRMMTSGLRSLVAIAAIGGTVALCGAPAVAQQKTKAQCTEEWRANKADNEAKHILLRDYLKTCEQAAATSAPPAAAPAAAPKAAPAAATTSPTPPKSRETTAVAPAGGFANEALAKTSCPSDTVVWVNEKSKIYHYSGHKDYGNTKEGTYMCEKAAMAANNRAAKNEKHP
jgi:hypothetical protein